MEITTTVMADGVEYRAESSDMETHIDKLYGIERMVERREKLPKCKQCDRRYELGDAEFCNATCAGDYFLDMQENVVAKGN